MKNRCKLFHRKFPNKRIAVTSLRRLYLKNKIRRKKVKQMKYMPEAQMKTFQERCVTVYAQLRQVQYQQRSILYLDEICFTKLSFQGKDWSGKNTNLAVDQRDIYTGYHVVIAAISEEKGVDQIMIYSAAIKANDFIEYLQRLRKRHGKTPLALFCDQLAVHKSRAVKPYYDSLDIVPVYNVGYSPEFNAIEAVFSKVKALYNRQRLNCLVNKTFFKP